MLVWLIQNTVLTAILALAVALLCRWKRIGPALRHALWVLVLLRLLVPPGLVNWPWPLPSPPVPAQTTIDHIATAAAAPLPADGVLDGIEIVRVPAVDEATNAEVP